jgi:hypothetical protein
MTLKRVIKFGSAGADVAACKRGMWRAGYYKTPKATSITPIFGPYAEIALAHLQRDHHIHGEAGCIGPKSFFVIAAWMDAYAKAQYASYGPPAANYYVNMFAHATGLVLQRTDQGVDFAADAGSRIDAPGKSKIVRAATDSGWPGPYPDGGFHGGGQNAGGIVQGVFLEGPHVNETWYTAEFIHVDVRVDQVVQAGERIARFYHNASSGVGIECGYLRPGQNEPCSSDTSGVATEGGKAWARFLRANGCPTHDNPGPGSQFCPCGHL